MNGHWKRYYDNFDFLWLKVFEPVHMLMALRDSRYWHEWLVYPGRHLRVYMRVNNSRWIDKRIGNRATLEIANIHVQERYQCKGVFSAFLKYNEELARRHSRVMYIEQVMSRDLVNYLLRNGYTQVEHEKDRDFSVNMYKVMV